MKHLIPFILLALLSSASATMVTEKSLKQLVQMADHIWGGEIISVYMLNDKGHHVTNPRAETGPGLTNTIFLEVAINPDQILKAVTNPIPAKISIPLWQMWHYSLGQIQETKGMKSIFLLTEKLDPAYPADFQRPLAEEQKIRSLIKKSTTKAKVEDFRVIPFAVIRPWMSSLKLSGYSSSFRSNPSTVRP